MELPIKRVIVTGSNKGIGWWIVEGILKNKWSFDYHVVLCSRNKENGDNAINELLKSYPDQKHRLTLGI